MNNTFRTIFELLLIAAIVFLIVRNQRLSNAPEPSFVVNDTVVIEKQVPVGQEGFVPDETPVRAPGFTEQALLDSLILRNSLIPYQGKLGGNMRFFDLTFANDRWVIGYFEDGHYGGEALFGYRKNESGGIEWKLLDAYLK